MRNEHLLNEARLRYSIGSKVSNYNLNKGCNFQITGNHFYAEIENGDTKILTKSTMGGGIYTVYCKNEWAIILELPNGYQFKQELTNYQIC